MVRSGLCGVRGGPEWVCWVGDQKNRGSSGPEKKKQGKQTALPLVWISCFNAGLIGGKEGKGVTSTVTCLRPQGLWGMGTDPSRAGRTAGPLLGDRAAATGPAAPCFPSLT